MEQQGSKTKTPMDMEHRILQPSYRTWSVDHAGVTSDRRSMFYVDSPVRILKIAGIVEGSTPSAVINLEYSKDTTAFTSLITANITVDSVTTPQLFFPTVKVVPAGVWLWLNVTSVGGTVDHLHLTVSYEQ